MRDGDVVVFALGALLGKVGGEGRVPMADIFRCVEDSVTKVARSAFLHMGVRPGKRQLSGFICRWRQAGIGKDLIRRIEIGEVADLGQDHRSHAKTHARDGGNR